MKKAVIRLGPLADGAALEKAKRGQIAEGRWYYGSPSMFDLVPRAPILIDHDGEGPAIGRIDELVRWSDGAGEWLAARCLLDDNTPDWVRQGTPASIGFTDLVAARFGSGLRFGGGVVVEASLISPGEQPRDPMARIVLLRDFEPPAPPVAPRTPTRRQPLLRRNSGTILGIR